MSLVTVIVPSLSLKPRVKVEGPTLHARTHLLVQFFSLFSYSRHMHVDRMAQTVELSIRRLWFFSSFRSIHFDDIDHIDYDFDSTGTSWGWTLGGYERTDQVEKYIVSLVLKDDEHVQLFSFIGEGAAHTGLEGMLLGGDSAFDYQGDQGDASLGFVEVLMEYTGKPLGRRLDVHLTDSQGNRRFCLECDRPNPPNKQRCQYCGGELRFSSS